MEHIMPEKRSWGGVARKLICSASALALAGALVPATAFATDNTSTYYTLPAANQVVKFEHEGTDASGNKYTYHYVTIGSSQTGRVAPMAQTYYEVLGLNYINAYRGPDSIFSNVSSKTINSNYTSGKVGSLQTRNSTLAIMGTSNNVSPDEYIWNYCCWANGATVADDSMALDHGNTTTGAVSVTVGGTEYADFPREIYTECDIVGMLATSKDKAIAPTSSYGDLAYAKWIELENQRSNRPRTGEYDPAFQYMGVSGTGASKLVETLHTVADTVDGVIAQHKDANGNYTLQSRYGGNRADGTGAYIDKYEDIVLGTQWYTLSELNKGTVAKAVTATLVGYDPDTGNYACRVYEAGSNDPNGNQYGGRVANYLASISNSITSLGLKEAQQPYNKTEKTYVKWYTPEQIVANCDAAFVCDAPSGNNISDYLATASDGNHYVVYAPAGVGQELEDRTEDLVSTRNAMVAAQAKCANFCFSYPANMFGNFYAQGVENGMLSFITASFTYPTIFGSNGLTDLFGYWAKNVWHVKGDSVQSIITSTTAGMSLTGQQIGTLSTNYENAAQQYFNSGKDFYLANKVAVDKFNGGNLKAFDATRLEKDTSKTATTEDTTSSLDKVTAAAPKAQTITSIDKFVATYDAVPTRTEPTRHTNTNDTYYVEATTSGDGAITMSSADTNVVTVTNKKTDDGVTVYDLTLTGAGTTSIVVNAAKTDNFSASQKVIPVTVKGASQTLEGTASYSKIFGDAAFTLDTTVKEGGGTLSYKSDKTSVATVDAAGKVTVTGAGTAKITATAAKAGNYAATNKTITVTVAKASQKLSAKASTKKLAYSKVKKSKKTVSGAIKLSGAQGSVSYAKSSGDKKLSINKSNGKITVAKGTKKGKHTIKVKVSASGGSNYTAASTTVSVTVQVK